MSNDRQEASSVDVAYCECGTISIRLYDKADKIFAVAPLPVHVAEAFAGSLDKAIVKVLEGNPDGSPDNHTHS